MSEKLNFPRESQEPPEERLKKLAAQVTASSEGGKAKGCFMDLLRSGGYDSDYAKVFGVKERGNREEYLDRASDWWDRLHGKAGQKVAESVTPREVGGEGSTERPVGNFSARLMKVSPVLGNVIILTDRVLDPSGRKSATIALLDRSQIPTPPDGDMQNIRTAITAPQFIPGVTGLMPHESRRYLPWQMSPMKRSISILPPGVGDLDSAPYFYAAKGLKFDPGEAGEFDLVKEGAFLKGEKIPEKTDRVNIIFGRDGLMHEETRTLEMYMGMDYEKAEKEFGMMVLALIRRLKVLVNIDTPVMMGVFDTVKSPAGRPQGFIITKVDDKGRRGDNFMTHISACRFGDMMSRNPEAKKACIDEAQEAIDRTMARTKEPPFQGLLESGQVTQRQFKVFTAILESSREFLDKFRTTKDPAELSVLFYTIGELQAYGAGVETEKFFKIKEVDPAFVASWRGDLEKTYIMAGMATRVVLEHGLAHEQTYAGNLRYDARGEEGIRVTICDWHDSHDLVGMTYPQAFGYAALSLTNLLHSAKRAQTLGFNRFANPDLVSAALRGYQLQVPGFREEARPVNEQLVRQVHRDVMEVEPRYRGSGIHSMLQVQFGAIHWKSGNEIPAPIFQFLGQIFPPEKLEKFREKWSGIEQEHRQ
ncbi:MAG: hypothetical protein V1703_00105, partial [Candidatus Altiarchaeota archaeon]